MVTEKDPSRTRDRKLAQLLTISAFIINTTWRSYAGTLVSVAVSSVAVFLMITSLEISKRVLGEASVSQDFYGASVSTLAYGLANSASKILVPAISEADLSRSVNLLAMWMVIVLDSYVILKVVQSETRSEDFFRLASDLEQLKKREVYERVSNGAILLSALSGLDGADLMFIVELVVAFSAEVYAVFHALFATCHSINRNLHSLLQGTAPVRSSDISETSRRPETIDADDLFWARIFSLIQYKQGLPFLFMSFMTGLPLLVVSYAIDILDMRIEYLVGLCLFLAPSVVFFLLAGAPADEPQHRQRYRTLAVGLAFIIPILSVAAAFFYPSIVPPVVTGSDLSQRQSSIGVAILMTITPVLVGVPLFRCISLGDQDDFEGFVRWGRIAGVSVFPVMLLLILANSSFAGINLSYLVLSSYVALSVTSWFYMGMCHVLVVQLESWERRHNIRLDRYIATIFNPGANTTTLFPSCGSGMTLFLLVFFLTPYASVLAVSWQTYLASFILTLITSLVLELKSRGRSIGGLWIGFFIASSFCLSYSLLFLTFLPFELFLQWVGMAGYRLAEAVLITTMLGTLLSVGVVMTRRAPERDDVHADAGALEGQSKRA
jgi:hypothetical protein